MLKNPYRGLFILRQFGLVHAFELMVSGLQKKQLLQSATTLYLPPLAPKTFSEQIGDDTSFDFIVTGTSSEAHVEEEIWSWAREKGLPCFAFHDQWVNTAARFQGVAHLPTDILVVDKAAESLVQDLNLGVPIAVIGSPVWDIMDTLAKARTHVEPQLMAFATEPAILASYKVENGFDDLDSLAMAIDSLENKQSQHHWKLMILVHPADRRERIEKFLSTRPLCRQVEIEVSRTPAYKVLEKAQYLLGMRSMLLVSASIAGIPVVSFQPHRTTSSPATDREGIEVVTDWEQIPEAFSKALQNKPRLPKISSSELFANFLKTRLNS